MENKECDCSKCEHWEECEIGLIVHNPYGIYEREYRTEGRLCGEVSIIETKKEAFIISKGDKVAQCTLKEHKGYLLGIESDTERTGGFGSTDKGK